MVWAESEKFLENVDFSDAKEVRTFVDFLKCGRDAVGQVVDTEEQDRLRTEYTEKFDENIEAFVGCASNSDPLR